MRFTTAYEHMLIYLKKVLRIEPAHRGHHWISEGAYEQGPAEPINPTESEGLEKQVRDSDFSIE